MLTAIKIRNGMEKTSFINHILYSAGATTKVAKTGANAIIEILKIAGLVEDIDGKINACVIEHSSGEKEEKSVKVSNTAEVVENVLENIETISSQRSGVQINLNLNIDIKGNELDELPEKLKLLLESIKE